MLETAEQRFETLGGGAKVEFIHSDVMGLPGRTGGPFDLILFHNVIEYVEDPLASLRSIKQLLSPDGMLSLRHINRYSNPLIPAIYEDDLETTVKYLNDAIINTSFGIEAMTFTRGQIKGLLNKTGYSVSHSYGVISLTGYMTNNEPKYDPAFYAQLKEIELRMAETFPYRELSRFSLVLAKKANA